MILHLESSCWIFILRLCDVSTSSKSPVDVFHQNACECIRMHFLISAKNCFFMEQTILGGNVSWNSESPTSTLSAWKWVFHLLGQVGWECLLWNWKHIVLGKYPFCLLFCNHVPGLQCKNDFFQYLQVIFSHHSLNPIYFPTIFSFSQSCYDLIAGSQVTFIQKYMYLLSWRPQTRATTCPF